MEAAIQSIESEARKLLAECPIYDIRNLEIEQSGGSLCISGRVNTYYHKQLAQEMIRPMIGEDISLVNDVDVL